MASYIVYDNEADEGKIKQYVESSLNALKLYSIDVNFASLGDWETDKYVDNRKTVAYIVSIDSEDFHTKVKPIFLQGSPNCMLVLFYAQADENHVKKFKTSVKNSLKKKEPNESIRKMKVKDTMDRIACVNELENISQWWPPVLKLLVQAQTVSNGKPARDIGVFFKIDTDDETQVEWLEGQRDTLEKTFKVCCRYNDGLMSDETYIKYSKCVVMYVNRKSYQDLRPGSAREKEKKKMLDAIEETRVACNKHGTMFQIFVDEAGVNLTDKLAKYCRMKIIGDGMLSYWLGLLSILGLIRVRRMPDTWFYSTKDQNEREVFKPEMYPHLFRSVLSPIEGKKRVASPSGIEAQTLRYAGGVKGVCYQSMETLVIELDDSIPRSSAACCNWLNIAI